MNIDIKKYKNKYVRIICKDRTEYGRFWTLYIDETDNKEYILIDDLHCSAKINAVNPEEIIKIEITDKEVCFKQL